jgi:diaphanous 1
MARHADDRKMTPSVLVKQLLSLRITLSTANVSWIFDFLRTGGLDILQSILKRTSCAVKTEDDVHEQAVFEILKSLRVLMNTDVSISLP